MCAPIRKNAKHLLSVADMFNNRHPCAPAQHPLLVNRSSVITYRKVRKVRDLADRQRQPTGPPVHRQKVAPSP